DRILVGRDDEHGGVIVEMESEQRLDLDPRLFSSLLKASISRWRQQGKKGIWIKVPIELVGLVQAAVEEGFYFHHAEPAYLMLVRWLADTPNTLPANASHRVGIGAFVFDENNQLLVVQEKSGRFRGSGVWKIPTGVVDQGEDICDAAVREVKEETGIDAKFLELLAFRQSHRAYFDKSDLFFVCLLEPLSFDIHPQEAEIEAAQWMAYEEYAAQAFNQKSKILQLLAEVCEARRNNRYSGFSAVSTSADYSKGGSHLYLD
ncbi:hypothetical protein M569_08976, partial [Genlisea aurea]